jgi:hypothetical protein
VPVESTERDDRPWDERLIARLSHGSNKSKPYSRVGKLIGITHPLVALILAVVSGTTYWIALAGVTVLALLARYAWPLARHARATRRTADTNPNPFGH